MARSAKLLKKEISMERLFPSGAWLCTALIDGAFVHKQYMGYTKREARDLFYREHK